MKLNFWEKVVFFSFLLHMLWMWTNGGCDDDDDDAALVVLQCLAIHKCEGEEVNKHYKRIMLVQLLIIPVFSLSFV